MRCDVLVLNGVFDTGLATVLDAFAIANDLAQEQGLQSLRFDVTVVGVRRHVRTSQGLRVPVASAEPRDPPDWAIVTAIGQRTPHALREALDTPEARDAVRVLAGWACNG